MVFVLLMLAVRIASRRNELVDEDEAAEELGGGSLFSTGIERYSVSFASGLRR